MTRPRSFNQLSFSTAQVNKSNILSQHDSTSSNINELTTSTNEVVMIESDADESINILNENLITKQIESIPNDTIEKHSSMTIDKAEEHKCKYQTQIKQIYYDNFLYSLDESNIDPTVVSTDASIIEQRSVDLSQPPSLPSSLPPNINTIKSSEMLPYSFRSITSLINGKQKSSTDIKNPSLPLRNARSTLDFGLLLDETTAQKF
jgi:hypothetical protein